MFDIEVEFCGFDWAEAFAQMEATGKAEAERHSSEWEYWGEVDCPEEMRGEPGVTNEIIAQCRGQKLNWLRNIHTGEWITCGDAALDAMIDNGKVI